MSQEWHESSATETGASSRRQRWSGEGAEGQRVGVRTRGQAATGASQSATTRAGRGAGEPVWQNRLQQMMRDAEQNLADGSLTTGYKADPKEIIALLKRAQAGEWTSFLQYWHHYFMASDIHSKEVQEVFEEHAQDEYDHARKIGDRIQQLGGVPCDNPEEILRLTPMPFEANHDMHSMLEADLIGERQTIDFYDEIIRTCGFDDNVTRLMFEGINAEEAEHANDFATLLFAFDGSTGQQIESVYDELQQLAKTTAQAPGQGQMRQTA